MRPTTLSIYKDPEGTKLRHQIALADIEAVARQKDPKRKAKHIFGLFSSARNYHIEAPSEKEAQEWVELIRREARIDEEEEEMILMSPTLTQRPNPMDSLGDALPPPSLDPVASSSSDADAPAPLTRPKGRSPYGPHTVSPAAMHSAARRPSHPLHPSSSNDAGSYSDVSESGAAGDGTGKAAGHAAGAGAGAGRPPPLRQASYDAERVVHQSWLALHRPHHHLRPWKAQWAVLRPSRLALYNDDDEYQPSLIIPFASVIDAVEVDRPADKKKKRYVFMVIVEEGGWRFDGGSEEGVLRWLGAIKSLVAKRRERVLLGEKDGEGEEPKEGVAKDSPGKEAASVGKENEEKPESGATALPVR